MRTLRPTATRRRRLRRAAHQAARRQLREQPGEQTARLSVRLEVNRHERGALNSRMDHDLRRLGIVAGDVTDLGPPIDEAEEWVERAQAHLDEVEAALKRVVDRRQEAVNDQRALKRRPPRPRAGGPGAELMHRIDANGAKLDRPVLVLGARGGDAAGESEEEPGTAWPVREGNRFRDPDGRSAAGGEEGNARRFSLRAPLLGPVVERLLLGGSAIGEFGLNYIAAQVMGLAPQATIAFTASVSIASIMAAVTMGRILGRVPEGPRGIERFRSRRLIDGLVLLLAGASGIVVAISIAFLREAYLRGIYSIAAQTSAQARNQLPPIDQHYLPWLRGLALGLLGLAVAVAYAGTPAQHAPRHPWRDLGSWVLKRIKGWWDNLSDRRWTKKELEIANQVLKDEDERMKEARAQLKVAEAELRRATLHRERLQEELERRGSKLLGLEQAIIRGWRSQADAGDAACHQLDRYLAAALVRHRTGLRARLLSWWQGRPEEHHETFEPAEPVAQDERSWGEQLGKVTRRAKELLANRGVLGASSVPEPDMAAIRRGA